MERHHPTEREDMETESERDESEVDEETITDSKGNTRPKDIFDNDSEESSVSVMTRKILTRMRSRNLGRIV